MSADRIPDRDRPDEDVDAQFARIIAGWNDPQAPVERRGRDDVPADSTAQTTSSPAAPAQPPASDATPPPLVAGPRSYSLAEEPDEGYVPPPPPPLPRGDLAGVLAWAAVILGPLFLLFAGLFWRAASPLWLGLAVVAFIGGFVALVMRLPAHRDDSSGDDGAVV